MMENLDKRNKPLSRKEEEKARGRAEVKCCACHVFFYPLFAFIFLRFHSPSMNLKEMLVSQAHYTTQKEKKGDGNQLK